MASSLHALDRFADPAEFAANTIANQFRTSAHMRACFCRKIDIDDSKWPAIMFSHSYIFLFRVHFVFCVPSNISGS